MGDFFSCDRCGQCCRGFEKPLKNEGKTQSDIDFMDGPLYYYSNASQLRPALFGWEVELLSHLNKNFEFTPRTFVYDVKTSKPLVLTYNLNNDRCVFLEEENNCSIYENRPLVCRSFPLVTSGLGMAGIVFHRYECPRSFDVELEPFMIDSDYAQLMNEKYGGVFLWALVRDDASRWLRKMVFDAERSGLVELVRNEKRKNVVEKIRGETPIDCLGYLKVLRPSMALGVESKTKEFYSIDYARKLFEGV